MDNNINTTNQNDSTSPQIAGLSMVTAEQLQSIGIDLPEDQMQALVQHTEDTIAEQIGEEIVDSLTDQELEYLVSMQESNAPAEQIEAWIVERVEDYQEIVEDNVAIVLGDLAENAEKIASPEQ